MTTVSSSRPFSVIGAPIWTELPASSAVVEVMEREEKVAPPTPSRPVLAPR